MQPIIETVAEKKLIGLKVLMTPANNKTMHLWQGFMPRRKEITNPVNTELISMQVYDDGLDFKDYTLNTLHQKWAAVEVTDFNDIPTHMETFILPGGLYAVFHYIGLPTNFADTFRYIFYTWLPASAYELDQRPHFEILGAKYKNNSPDSEEDIYIPIGPKSK
jgi:AraC family transcriptional regulator